MSLTRWIWAGCWWVTSACNSLDEPGPRGSSVLVIPVDTRPLAQALQTPPPISGGTLAATPDGRFAVAADPDRDRVSVVDLDSQVVRQIALNRGDEPGRVVTDASGHAYVALRRAGDVVRIDVVNAALLERTHVCAAPRGMALQPALGALHVACNEGRLVTLRAEDSDSAPLTVTRDLRLDGDLRDVVVHGDQLQVSTFKSAELLTLDANGTLLGRDAARVFTVLATSRVPSLGLHEQPLQAHVAWRTLASASGETFMLHQGASTETVNIDKAELEPRTDGTSAYGGANCQGIVVPALTRVTPGQAPLTTPVNSGTLTVDLAISSDGEQLATVSAGSLDPEAPRPRTVVDPDEGVSFASGEAGGLRVGGPLVAPTGVDVEHAGTSQVTLLDTSSLSGAPRQCAFGVSTAVLGQATALTYVTRRAGHDELLVQSREPALLTIVSDLAQGPALVTIQPAISLGGESVLDTGHAIFHRDAGGGIACASCHAEGAEDGHVWSFNTVGLRRTQALHVGLEGTAPFHWNGEESDLGHLMEDVFVGRMGGVHQSEPRLTALASWLFALQPPAADASLDAEAVERGRALFMSAQVGCAECHNGVKLTNNRSVDVGTGAVLQVPSLHAVAYRAPFMHNGCAKTLRDRFDPACGGSKHGDTAGLSDGQLDDLVAYLKTL